jgi:hypothetical protein
MRIYREGKLSWNIVWGKFQFDIDGLAPIGLGLGFSFSTMSGFLSLPFLLITFKK